MVVIKVKQIFVNLPVKDLKKSQDFFKALGFSFNPDFTDDNGACLELGDNIFAMLLTENFFKTFTSKQIADAGNAIETINCVSFASRNEVDTISEKAIKAGGTEHREPQDYGWMYSRSLLDIDGHTWEFAFMDEAALAEQMKQS